MINYRRINEEYFMMQHENEILQYMQNIEIYAKD